MDQRQIIEFLASPRAFPHQGQPIRRIDTHISCVFLTSECVYKLKKELQFDFLDYSTLERRKWACQQEVALNRRLADDVYRGVVAVTHEEDGQLAIDGAGPAVEWLVEMRRLPDEATLLHHLQAGTVSPAHIAALGDTLSEFYRHQGQRKAEAGDASTGADYVAHLRSHVQGNRAELAHRRHQLDQQLIVAVHQPQMRLLNLCEERFAQRKMAGRVIDGHGDLRPEHVYFLPHPVIIDCIEFNAEFRQIDVLDELAFLAVECERLGADWIGRQLLTGYARTTGDDNDPLLTDFYAAYRACVRAKVHCLRALQLSAAEAGEQRQIATSYLQLAQHHADRLRRPLLLVVHGLSGTGKSTVARALGESLQIKVFSTDDLRQQLFAQTPPAEKYRAENRQRVYDELLRQADKQLEAGNSAIIDGTFLESANREQAVALAQRTGALTLMIHCHCDRQMALARIAHRQKAEQSTSDATAEVYQQQLAVYQPDQGATAKVLELDTQNELPANVEEVRRILFPCEVP